MCAGRNRAQHATAASKSIVHGDREVVGTWVHALTVLPASRHRNVDLESTAVEASKHGL